MVDYSKQIAMNTLDYDKTFSLGLRWQQYVLANLEFADDIVKHDFVEHFDEIPEDILKQVSELQGQGMLVKVNSADIKLTDISLDVSSSDKKIEHLYQVKNGLLSEYDQRVLVTDSDLDTVVPTFNHKSNNSEEVLIGESESENIKDTGTNDDVQSYIFQLIAANRIVSYEDIEGDAFSILAIDKHGLVKRVELKDVDAESVGLLEKEIDQVPDDVKEKAELLDSLPIQAHWFMGDVSVDNIEVNDDWDNGLKEIITAEGNHIVVAPNKDVTVVDSDNNIVYTDNEDIKQHQMNDKSSKSRAVNDTVKDVVKSVENIHKTAKVGGNIVKGLATQGLVIGVAKSLENAKSKADDGLEL